MLKLIFTQLWNRKRSNIWLSFELLLVFCLIWYMVDSFFVLNYNLNIPNGRNMDHTWQIAVKEYSSKSPNYREEANNPEVREANYARILQTIRNYPGVESLGISFSGSSPGSGSYQGRGFANPDDSTKMSSGQMITIDPETDFFQVFRYSSGKDKAPVSVKDFDWTVPNGVVVCNKFAETLFPGENAVGKELASGHSPDAARFIILGIVNSTKRFHYERPQYTFYFSRRIDASNIAYLEISVRITTSDKLFREKFVKEMTPMLQIGNFYLERVRSYNDIEADMNNAFGMTNYVRVQVALMTFFLLNIILCVIGTFWYRVNVRREEIGLRKAMGSTKEGIRNNLILEGLCLLAIVLIPAMIIEYQFVHAGLIETLGQRDNNLGYLPDKTLLRFFITNGITWLLMATVVTLAIWLPATKAAEMEAADALRDE